VTQGFFSVQDGQ